MTLGAGRFRLEETTIKAVHAAMRGKRLTSLRLVEMYLSRIEAYDKNGPSLNSVILVNPKALEIADKLDRRARKSGLVGPLHGIPVLLKDNVNTRDMETTGGSLCLKSHVPPEDAFIVRRLREGGAIVLGKTNLHEFAVSGETVSSILGQTLNPYDLKRTPGGSSGGTGAALAANFGVIGIGTDTVNSIRSPASANSLVGIRPTLGLISRSGIIPHSSSQDVAGPMARTVADAVKMLDVISGDDLADSDTAWNIGNVREDYTKYLDPKALRGARIGVLQTFFGTETVHQEVNGVINEAVKRMKKLGAVVLPINNPAFDSDKIVSEVTVHLHELKANLDSYLGNPKGKAPVKSLEEIILPGKYHTSIGEAIKQAQALSQNDPDYKERLIRRMKLQNLVMRVMAENKLDALVYPHQKRLVVPVGKKQVDRNGVLAAVTGFPAITLPGGFSKPAGGSPIGVPVGIEFLGRPWGEPTLIRLAYSFERATKFRRPPLSVPALR
jgi:amidase